MDARSTHDYENVKKLGFNMQADKLEKLVITSLETAQSMLKEYGLVIPFGIRMFHDSDDQKMNCPAKEHVDADWEEQINMVVDELREFIKNENISATALVTGLENDDTKGVGLQIENEDKSVMFVYPYYQQDDSEEWTIDEPIQAGQMFKSVYRPA